MRILFSAILLCLSFSLLAETSTKYEIAGVFYYKNIFGIVHQNASRYSTALTTLTCGHPVKVYSRKDIPQGWEFVKVGAHEGYLRKEQLHAQRPDCFQDKYPRFFDSTDLDLSELYYWGRLYDQYVEGKSRVR